MRRLAKSQPSAFLPALNYWPSTANRLIEYPSAAPRKTSEGKCDCKVSRENATVAAALYASHATQWCCGYRRAKIVATENAAIVCPDGKLPDVIECRRSKKVSEKSACGGMSDGRSLRVETFITLETISVSSIASPAKIAV